MAQQLYRDTAMGRTLQDSLDELIQRQKISPQMAQKILLKFDKTAPASLSSRLNNQVRFKGRLVRYRCTKDGWTFFLRKVEFVEVLYQAVIQRLKIMASKG